MKPLRFHASARRELREAARFYEARQPGLGERWLTTFETAAKKIQNHSGKGRPSGIHTRQYRVPNFPYAIIFQDRSSDVYIVAITHLRREPRYWVDRLRLSEP